MSLQPITVLGYDQRGGLQTNKKPFLIPEQAFQTLENAYAWRDRVVKRKGIKYLGQLQRNLVTTLGESGTSPWFFNIFEVLGLNTISPNANVVIGTVVIGINGVIFTDQGNGILATTVPGNGGIVDYATGDVGITTLQAPTFNTSINFNYYPSLPVMGIQQREIANINTQQTIFFDTVYAYIWNGSTFQEFIPGTTWAGTNSDFFWTTNYRGINPQDRLFFATNYVNDSADPMRYTDGNTWTTFAPILAANDTQTQNIGSISDTGSSFSGNLPNPPIIEGSVTITVAGITFTDSTGSGTLTGNPNTNTGTINYATGAITLSFNPTINFTGSITGITTNANATVTSVAHNLTTGAQLTITGVVGTNVSQINDQTFTITVVNNNNFQINSAYTGVYASGGTWTLTNQSTTVVAVYQTGSTFLFQARLLIPYFGRLLALNVWEGSTIGNAVRIYNRCRFSQVGSPVNSDSWRTDIFGKGGFLDAPTNEAIVSCTFLNNTLIVFFERTTWQLRYVGEYGLPFIWERIASDLGSESTFAPVLFNEHILAIGDKAIIAADSNAVNRIDLEIPDQIFNFQNTNFGVFRVQGIRDYQKELVYWCFADAQTQAAPGVSTIYPNKVLVYNYRNRTWAIFRDNVTAFGTLQVTDNITWDSQSVYWDSDIVTWDDFDTQSAFPLIVSGNQEGFCHFYQEEGNITTPEITPIDCNEQQSLTISAIATNGFSLQLTIYNHNLEGGEIIYISGMLFRNNISNLLVPTSLNNTIYQVSIVDANTVTLFLYDFTDQTYFINFPYTPNLSTSTYIGGGYVTLLQKISVQTKDFNPFQGKGLQTKLAYVDFLMDIPSAPPFGYITGATNANPCVITSDNHGLITGQNVFIDQVEGMTQLNISSYYIVTVIDANTFSINVNSTNFGTYSIGGEWTLLVAGMSVQLFLNSSPSISGNILVGNLELGNTGTPSFYGPSSDYAWFRFYSTCAGQYFNILMTYDDSLMNTFYTHQQDWILNAMNVWVRPGGKIMF